MFDLHGLIMAMQGVFKRLKIEGEVTIFFALYCLIYSVTAIVITVCVWDSLADGGWGWLIVASAFLVQMLSDGISYGFGILYIDLMATFQGTSAKLSTIGSLSYGTFCFIGPVAGSLTNRFGYRFVAILGTILEALGLFLSAFSPNLGLLYFSVGILIGVGGGMIYIACFVFVSVYFESMRPLATSISSCGSSIGTFVFGFLYRLCIDHYGWRGTLIVFAGLMLNGIVCGTLFRPFAKENHLDVSGSIVLTESGCLETATGLEKQNLKTNFNTNFNTEQEQYKRHRQTQNHIHPYSDETDIPQDQDSLLCSQLDPTSHICKDSSAYDENIHFKQMVLANRDSQTNRSLNKTVKMNSSNICSKHVVSDTEHKFGAKKIASLILGTTNLSMFKDVGFVLYGVSTFLFCFGLGIPYVLLPDMAEMNGFTPAEAAWVISEFGIASTFGRSFFGLLSQLCTKRYKHANVKLSSISLVLSGVFIACAPWTFTYSVLLVVGGAFGFSAAAGSVLATVVVIDLVGNEHLPDSLGWVNVFSGTGFLIGPSVAGWLYDVTKSYIAAFMAAGVSLVLAGTVLLPIFVSDSFRACCKHK